jgi:hypothetical protein
MLKKLIVTGMVLAAAYVVMNSLPDLARYLKMREM